MSRVFSLFGLLGFAFIAQVASHGHLSIPMSRDKSLSKRQDEQNAPVTYPVISDFVCRNYSASPASEWTTLTAGSTTPIQWALEAPHPGDCFAYLTYDGDSVPDTQKKWFKIAEFGQCNLQNVQTQQLTIPSYLPSCDHCILRWEWYALHLQSINIVEFYSQCADVRIIGKANGQLPSPQVTIPGHLPMDAVKYRPGFNTQDFTMTGPPIATIGGPSYSCVNKYGSSCIKPSPTANPCTISTQRCMSATTYQACGIGATTTVWGPEQSCQTGLVCAEHPDGAHIMCTWPSYTPPTPAPAPVPTPKPAPTPVAATTGKAAPSTTGRVANVAATTGRIADVKATTGKVASAPTTPSTTGKPINAAPTPNSNGSCTKLGSMVCVGQSSYQTCSQTSLTSIGWAAPQNCPTGLKCQPAGDWIYCV